MNRFRLQKGDWVILPLAIIALLCGYQIFQNWQGPLSVLPSLLSGWNIFTTPNWAALLLIVFSMLYIYKTVRRRRLPVIAKIAAYVPSILLAAVLFLIIKQSDSCSFAGGAISCSSAQYLLFWLVFFNPFVTPVLVVLSGAGIVSLLLGRKEQK